MLNFGLSMGRTGLGVKPPLLQGNYIWYSLDPETGYIVGANRVNYVKDEGNIGTFDGTLYSSGKLDLTQIVDELGPELILNGTFDANLNGWEDNNAHWQWVDGRAYHPLTNENWGLNQSIGAGSVKILEFDAELVQGTAGVEDGITTYNIDHTGHYRIELPINANKIYFKRVSNAEFYIDNVTVKEHIYQDGGYVDVPLNYSFTEVVPDPDFLGNNLDGWTISGDAGASSITVVEEQVIFDYQAVDDAFLNMRIDLSEVKAEAELTIVVSELTGEFRVEYSPDSPYEVISTVGVHRLTLSGNVDRIVIARNSPSEDVHAIIDMVSFRVDEEVKGAVTYFDYGSNSFVQPSTPDNNVFRIEKQVIGTICRLWETVFTDDDLAILNQDPLNLIKWYNGESLGISIHPNANDMVYLVDELDGNILKPMRYTPKISPYTVEVKVPDYDPNNPEHLIVDQTNWNETTLNDTAYKHFYVVPDTYTTQLTLRESGTEDEPRTISPYNVPDVHPAKLTDAQRINISVHWESSHYWHLKHISTINARALIDPTYQTPFRASMSSHIVFHQPYGREFPTFFIVGPDTHNTVLQQGYLDTMDFESLKGDNVAWEIAVGNVDSVNVGNMCLDTDFVNCNDATQLVMREGVTTDYPGTIINGNRAWMDGRYFTDGTFSMPNSPVAMPVPYSVDFSGSVINLNGYTPLLDVPDVIVIGNTASNDGTYNVVSYDTNTITVAETFTEELDAREPWIMTEQTNPNFETFVYDGQYMVGENWLDLKTGTDDADNQIYISDNYSWGYKHRDVTVQGANYTKSDGKFLPIHFGVRGVNFFNNIHVYGQQMISAGGVIPPFDFGLKNCKFHDNIFAYSYIENPTNDTPYVTLMYDTIDYIGYFRNTVAYAGSGVYEAFVINYNANTYGVRYKQNILLDAGKTSNDINDNIAQLNYYYNTEQNFTEQQSFTFDSSSEALLAGFVIDYDRWTNEPHYLFVPKVVTTKQSPHFLVAGANIAPTDVALGVDGNYVWSIAQIGVPSCRINDDNSVIKTNLIRCNEDTVISTGIAIDGSQTDFTMMLGFTLPEITEVGKYLANSSGDNRVFIYHSKAVDLNKLTVGVGKYTQTVTFDETKPIHAMVAVYNHTTSQLQVAIDGEPLSAPFDIVFDGPTGDIYLGASSSSGGEPFKGYLSEGVLSATMESEDAWFTFWDRIKEVKCPRPQGEIFSNRNFDCGADYWELDPNYGGSITDNGDGTVTLTATEDFSSLTQLDKFPLPAGRYHVGCVVSAISGDGKYSYKLADGTWINALQYNSAGTYETDIDVSQEIIAIAVGASSDADAVITYDGIACIDLSKMPMPDWYKIASLDSADILGVWDWTWIGHGSQSDTLVNLEGSMPNFSIDTGTPTWQGHENGLNFGGAGSIASLLPDGLDNRNITVIMEFHGTLQKGSLDAFYSHFRGDSQGHYTLQNGWGNGSVRWSCGDETSPTIEISGVRTEGVLATAGRNLYHDGALIGTVGDSDASATANTNFTFGCIVTDSTRTQYCRTKLKKLLIVQRELTEAEVQEITNNINGVVEVLTTDSGEPLTTDNGEEITI